MDKEIKNIEESLKQIVGSKSGFSIPNSYFSELEDKLHINAIEDSFSTTEGFDVPDTYFDSIEESILEKVREPKQKVISLNNRVLKWIPAIAASVLLLFTLIFFDFSSDELTEDDLVAWFENDIESINQVDLLVAFEDVDLEDENFIPASINEIKIEDYLNNEDITNLFDDLN